MLCASAYLQVLWFPPPQGRFFALSPIFAHCSSFSANTEVFQLSAGWTSGHIAPCMASWNSLTHRHTLFLSESNWVPADHQEGTKDLLGAHHPPNHSLLEYESLKALNCRLPVMHWEHSTRTHHSFAALEEKSATLANALAVTRRVASISAAVCAPPRKFVWNGCIHTPPSVHAAQKTRMR